MSKAPGWQPLMADGFWGDFGKFILSPTPISGLWAIGLRGPLERISLLLHHTKIYLQSSSSYLFCKVAYSVE